MNQWVARITGLLLFIPSIWFRYFHLAHHRYTQDLLHDPELQSGKPQTLSQWTIHLTGFPVWCSQITTLFNALKKPCKEDFLPQDKRFLVRREIQLMWAVYISLFALSILINQTVLLYIWIIPLLLGQPFLRLYLLAEHGNCPAINATIKINAASQVSACSRQQQHAPFFVSQVQA